MTAAEFQEEFYRIITPFIEGYNEEIGTNPVLTIDPTTLTIRIEPKLLQYLPEHVSKIILQLRQEVTW